MVIKKRLISGNQENLRHEVSKRKTTTKCFECNTANTWHAKRIENTYRKLSVQLILWVNFILRKH